MTTLFITFAVIMVLVIVVSTALRFIFKRPIGEIISDWLAQSF